MLNPRAFLEDAMLAGLRGFWNRGLPWHLVNAAIDSDFNYNVTDQCKARWTKQTGLPWDNQSDPLVKELQCPKCNTKLSIPWTTCSRPENFHDQAEPLDLTGTGYGDGNLQHTCKSCGITVCKELLCAFKFVKDVEALLGPTNRPIPGTVLEPTTGRPAIVPPEPERSIYPRTFPNRLLKSGCNSIRTKVTTLMTSRPNPTMQDIRVEIEAILGNSTWLREINKYSNPRSAAYRVGRASKLSIRKMMGHYWENFSPFALDLAGAVVRQGIFIEKMYKIDWLHSPSATDTMKRLLLKYARFFTIMQKNPTKMAVPTLDIDLAWHTHQLSPSKYYKYSIKTTDKFIDHDDKVEEGRLSEQFEWTSKEYQDTYGEVYSECTCWYCECKLDLPTSRSSSSFLDSDHNITRLLAIRTSHVNSLGQVLGVSKSEKSMYPRVFSGPIPQTQSKSLTNFLAVAEAFHASEKAKLCPPDKSAHISSHNAVMLHVDPSQPNPAIQNRVRIQVAALHQKRLDDAYAKAKKRAEKKGRTIPPRDAAYYDHWGYPYYMAGPYMYPIWFTPGLYYGWDPGYIAGCGTGANGACAAGTCGGGVAAGGCGGAGVSYPYSYDDDGRDANVDSSRDVVG